MNLRRRFLIQNIIVAAVTVLLTAVSGLLYVDICEKKSAEPSSGDAVAVVSGDEILYKSADISDFDIRSAVMENAAGKNKIKISQTDYVIETKKTQNKNAYIMMLKPIKDIEPYYRNLLFIIMAVFSVTYLIGICIIQYYNKKDIENPIVNLSRDAVRLADGELNIPVGGSAVKEIGQLCESVEKLRLRLCESVYDKKRYDENRKFLISGISHDLKTPITAVRGYIEGVLDGVVTGEEKRRKYLEAAIKKTDTIKTMIEDLLLYSKLDLNQIPFDITEVSAKKYTEQLIEDAHRSFELENKTLEFECDVDENVKIAIDTERFKRVISNITDNAKKNILPESGKVKITLRETKKTVIIEIADNGTGINEKDIQNIFNRFYRGDNARKNDGSSGLGLTIAKQIVTGHGGRIWATSEPGCGTKMMVSLRKV